MPPIRFRTTDPATLSSVQTTATVGAAAVLPGPSGNIAKGAIVQINPIYAGHYLSFGAATVGAANLAPFTGGDLLAVDETYRAQLLRLPRTQTEEEWVLAFLEKDGLIVHPGFFFDFEEPAYVVVSLLGPEAEFSTGISRLVARVAAS